MDGGGLEFHAWLLLALSVPVPTQVYKVQPSLLVASGLLSGALGWLLGGLGLLLGDLGPLLVDLGSLLAGFGRSRWLIGASWDFVGRQGWDGKSAFH